MRAQLLGCCSHILLKFFHRVLERRSRVVDFVDDEYVLANKVGHLKGGQIEPLGPRNLGAWRLDRIRWIRGWKLFVEGEANGLDRNIGSGWPLEK